MRAAEVEAIRIKPIEAEQSGFVEKSPSEILAGFKEEACKNGYYKLSAKAETDLRRIWLHGLDEFDETQADGYYLKFFTRFEQLAERKRSS